MFDAMQAMMSPTPPPAMAGPAAPSLMNPGGGQPAVNPLEEDYSTLTLVLRQFANRARALNKEKIAAMVEAFGAKVTKEKLREEDELRRANEVYQQHMAAAALPPG